MKEVDSFQQPVSDDTSASCGTGGVSLTWGGAYRNYVGKKCVSLLPCAVNNANMSEKKAVIKNVDMSEDMQQDAVDFAMQAMDKFNIEKDIAAFVKKVLQVCSWSCSRASAVPANLFCFSSFCRSLTRSTTPHGIA